MAGSDLLAIARTDSEAATLITSTIDTRDHAYILGSTNANLESLSYYMQLAENANTFGDKLQAVEDDWIETAGLKLFDDAVIYTIKSGNYSNKENLIMQYTVRTKGRSNDFCR